MPYRNFFNQEPQFDPNKNYYKILDVSPTASDEEIRRQYFKMQYQYKQGSQFQDAAKLEEVEQSYQVLSNQSQRKAYDQARNPQNQYNKTFTQDQTQKQTFDPKKAFNNFKDQASDTFKNQGDFAKKAQKQFKSGQETAKKQFEKTQENVKKQFKDAQRQAESEYKKASNNPKSFWDPKRFQDSFKQKSTKDRQRLINMLILGFGSLFILKMTMASFSQPPPRGRMPDFDRYQQAAIPGYDPRQTPPGFVESTQGNQMYSPYPVANEKYEAHKSYKQLNQHLNAPSQYQAPVQSPQRYQPPVSPEHYQQAPPQYQQAPPQYQQAPQQYQQAPPDLSKIPRALQYAQQHEQMQAPQQYQQHQQHPQYQQRGPPPQYQGQQIQQHPQQQQMVQMSPHEMARQNMLRDVINQTHGSPQQNQ